MNDNNSMEKSRELARKISLAHRGPNSKVMYCVRVEIRFMGEDAPRQVYLRFKPHGMTRGYSPWTEDIREAKFWLYKDRPYTWLNIQNRHLRGEVLKLERDDAVIKAQKDIR